MTISMTMEIAMVMKMSMAAVITTATKISMMMLSQPAPLADLYKLLLPAVIALLHPHSP